jgi:hypothetical protein
MSFFNFIEVGGINKKFHAYLLICVSIRVGSELFKKFLAASLGTKKVVLAFLGGFQGIAPGDKDFADRVLHQLIGCHFRSGSWARYFSGK